MRTVLFFVYSNKYICANRIDGIRRYAVFTRVGDDYRLEVSTGLVLAGRVGGRAAFDTVTVDWRMV